MLDMQMISRTHKNCARSKKIEIAKIDRANSNSFEFNSKGLN